MKSEIVCIECGDIHVRRRQNVSQYCDDCHAAWDGEKFDHQS